MLLSFPGKMFRGFKGGQPRLQEMLPKESIVERLLALADSLAAWCTWIHDLRLGWIVQHELDSYVAMVSFITAHHHAQQAVLDLLGEEADTAEDIALMLESSRQIRDAQASLNLIGGEDMNIFNGSIVSDLILDRVAEFIHQFVQQGLITDLESKSMLRQIKAAGIESHTTVRPTHRETWETLGPAYPPPPHPPKHKRKKSPRDSREEAAEDKEELPQVAIPEPAAKRLRAVGPHSRT